MMLVPQLDQPAGCRTIEGVIEEDPGVVALRDLRTMHLGPSSLLIVASVELAPDLDVGGAARVAARLRRRLGEVLQDVTTPRLIVIEPAVPDASERRAA